MHKPSYGEAKQKKKQAQDGRCQNKFNLLCLNKIYDTYYRAYDGCKSTIDLKLANLAIVSEMKWKKKFNFRNSDYFLIILREITAVMKHNQSKLSTSQELIEKAENTIPKIFT